MGSSAGTEVPSQRVEPVSVPTPWRGTWISPPRAGSSGRVHSQPTALLPVSPDLNDAAGVPVKDDRAAAWGNNDLWR